MLIPDTSFENNRSQRLPVVIVNDLSTSMLDRPSGINKRLPIDYLNEGRTTLACEIQKDEVAARCARIHELAFGEHDEVWTVTEPCDTTEYSPQPLEANGSTPLGAAALMMLDAARAEAKKCRDHGVSLLRPWGFLMTDGVPTDDWNKSATACRAAEDNNEIIIFPVGIGERANLEILSQFSSKGNTLHIETIKFNELFKFISDSITKASLSGPGEQVEIANGLTIRL